MTKNDTNSQWSLFFTDLDALLSDYEQHRSMNDITITEHLTIHLEKHSMSFAKCISVCITN